MAQQQMTSSQKALMLELKSLQEEPVEGFRITLVDESDLCNWEVAIFGPPNTNTLYEGGYFKAHIKFPIDHPYSPPTFRFLTKKVESYSESNVDASVMFRKWRDSKGKDKEYAEIIKQVSATKAEAEKDGVKVPTTLAEYCIKTKVPSNDNSSDLLYDDLYDDIDEDEEEEDADCYDDDDSGNEES
ncbi:Ubiquitin-conjugating enzyme E2 R2 [Sciurus carolinensis]|uniref:Ubiquitin-conjugating enzyme E2 R2 n=1 Tax=Sciurus carolinensis TaxID=30640 RepID=A0AA41MM27_SCICA|nr:Ubiquitin-conjugating enzyme E2 R2 [Sciurus carolinensis]